MSLNPTTVNQRRARKIIRTPLSQSQYSEMVDDRDRNAAVKRERKMQRLERVAATVGA